MKWCLTNLLAPNINYTLSYGFLQFKHFIIIIPIIIMPTCNNFHVRRVWFILTGATCKLWISINFFHDSSQSPPHYLVWG